MRRAPQLTTCMCEQSWTSATQYVHETVHDGPTHDRACCGEVLPRALAAMLPQGSAHEGVHCRRNRGDPRNSGVSPADRQHHRTATDTAMSCWRSIEVPDHRPPAATALRWWILVSAGQRSQSLTTGTTTLLAVAMVSSCRRPSSPATGEGRTPSRSAGQRPQSLTTSTTTLLTVVMVSS